MVDDKLGDHEWLASWAKRASKESPELWGFYIVWTDATASPEEIENSSALITQLAKRLLTVDAARGGDPDGVKEGAELRWLAVNSDLQGKSLAELQAYYRDNYPSFRVDGDSLPDGLVPWLILVVDREARASLATETPFVWSVDTLWEPESPESTDMANLTLEESEWYKGYYKVLLSSLLTDYWPNAYELFSHYDLAPRREHDFFGPSGWHTGGLVRTQEDADRVTTRLRDRFGWAPSFKS